MGGARPGMKLQRGRGGAWMRADGAGCGSRRTAAVARARGTGVAGGFRRNAAARRQKWPRPAPEPSGVREANRSWSSASRACRCRPRYKKKASITSRSRSLGRLEGAIRDDPDRDRPEAGRDPGGSPGAAPRGAFSSRTRRRARNMARGSRPGHRCACKLDSRWPLEFVHGVPTCGAMRRARPAPPVDNASHAACFKQGRACRSSRGLEP